VNSTFYRLASHDAVERWAADTPDGFCFAVITELQRRS